VTFRGGEFDFDNYDDDCFDDSDHDRNDRDDVDDNMALSVTKVLFVWRVIASHHYRHCMETNTTSR